MEQIIVDRRCLHRIPELDRDLPETMGYIRASLEALPCRCFSPTEGSLCAWFDFGAQDAIAFRADCDALPIQEQTGAPYASRHPGRMHACGHDGHMAMLLELARRLSRKERLPHNVLLVFQPAEEEQGGARDICETGVLEDHKVRAIFGMHLWPGLAAGKVFTRKGELMSRSSEVTVDVYGKSAHIAKASQGIDALMAAGEFYRQAVAMEQAMDPKIFRLLKFGKFQSGTVRNALSAHSHLEGSLRAFQDPVFDAMVQSLRDLGRQVEQQYGCTVKLHLSQGYPAILNPGDLVDRAARAVALELLEEPSMTSEDFSWYQRYVPGLFFFLGLGDTPALHADTFDFDESILMKGADLFEGLAERFL